jgi:hypothetical protein
MTPRGPGKGGRYNRQGLFDGADEVNEDDIPNEEDDGSSFDDEIEIFEKRPPRQFKGRSVRPPTFYHKTVVLREYGDSDAASLKMLEQDCLYVIQNYSFGSTKLVDKLIDYEDRVRRIAEETNQSVAQLLKKAGIMSPERMHKLVIDKALGQFAQDYEKLSGPDKSEIFGRVYEPGHKRKKR